MEIKYDKLFQRCLEGDIPTYDEVIELLKIELASPDFYALCYTANKLSQDHFDNKGDVCAQIGLDYEPCSRDCDFCSFSKKSGILEERMYWEPNKVAKVAKSMVDAGANAVYLMTTAEYPIDEFINIGKIVRESIESDIPLVANTGDFSYEDAVKLKEAGFSAVYHALRLREGTDTAIPVDRRIKTIENAKKAGLKVQVCLEPVGPEHTAEELADQMFWAREIGASFNGAMRRTAVSGTPLAEHGEISFLELAKLVAVSRLVMGDKVQAHCTHEPNLLALKAGANLLWAEAGPNPRDTKTDTSEGRGASVVNCQEMLINAGLELRKGPSPACF